MIPFRISLFAAVLLSACATIDPEARALAESADVAVVNVAVVPMDEKRVLASHTVLVEGDQITWVGPADAVEIPDDVLQIDGAGKYLMPGLVDSHVHAGSEEHMQLYVANGITTVRNLWGRARHLEWRERMSEDADFVAPSIYTAGPLIDGDPPTLQGSAVAVTAEMGAAVVTEQAKAGYDFLKVYNRLPAEAYDAILETANDNGLTVQGHVPDSVGLFRALDSGQYAIEHLSGYMEAASSQALTTDFGSSFQQNVVIAERLANGDLTWDEVFDPDVFARAVQATRDSGTWNIPTLVLRQMVASDEYEERASAPGTQYVDPRRIEGWAPEFFGNRNPDRTRDLRALYHEFGQRMIAALHEAGGNLLVGTDTPNAWVLPGFSIHEELARFVAAGLSPYETLERATRIPAEFMGEDDRVGTVSAKRRADLLLLDANPLEDVGNVQELSGVMLRGRWLAREDIAAMLERIEVVHDETRAQIVVDREALQRFQAPGPWPISDFEDGEQSASVGRWTVLSDRGYIPGSSSATVEVVEDGAAETHRSLRIRGTIATSDGGPNAPGAWYLPGGPRRGVPSRPVDVTEKSQVVFWAKGDGATYRIGLTFGPVGDLIAGLEFQSFRASDEWTEISLPLSGFVGADLGQVSGILFSGPEATGSFNLQIDELRLR